MTRPLRVAIIGAGPSGFYAADGLLKAKDDVSVDLYDRLPTPYGLVRYGVAPDHQKIKSVTKMYERTAADERFRFIGNICFGKDIRRAELRQHYDALIYTVGASADRALGISGETLAGSHSATEFVAWYNGHPDYAEQFDQIDATGVAVIGMGNVAVDVTRILAKTAEELSTSDIADHALELLKDSRVTDIYMLGRRGPAQGKFTTKELRELGDLANADIVVNKEDLELDAASEASIADIPGLKKNVEVLQAFAEKPLGGKPRRVHLKFFVSPVEILGDTHVEGIRLVKNKLVATESGYLNAVATDEHETLDVQMVLRSVGYRGVALPDVPFDERRGIIPNKEGRVLESADGDVVPGEYVAGWIKRGPSGVIGTNKADALETIEHLVADYEGAVLEADDTKSNDAIMNLLEQKELCPVSFSQWQQLDQKELADGEAQGRPRVKVTLVKDMLELCK